MEIGRRARHADYETVNLIQLLLLIFVEKSGEILTECRRFF